MNRYWKCHVMLLFLLLVPGRANAAMQLVYPANMSWVYRSDYIILKTNDTAITGVKMTVNGIDGDIMQISSPGYRMSFQDILIVQPVWDKGKNTLLVEAFAGTRKVQAVSAEIFYNPLGDKALIPSGYEPNTLHSVEREKLCSVCHDMSPGQERKGESKGAGNECAKCHRKLAQVKFRHEPVTDFNCSYCHVKPEKPKHGVARRDTALCYDCHSDKADYIKKSNFPHGPVAGGMCEICHDPHGTDFPALLRMPINDLCLSCHEKIGKRSHVLQTSGTVGHPLSGKMDISPKRKGKDLSCASCHDPHGGKVRYFFVSGSSERMDLCQFCHVK